MSHRSYAKGYRFERKVQAWLVHLGQCARSFMSRGADLILTRPNFSIWPVSCKCRAKGKITYSMIKEELEKHAICATGEDRDPFPMIHMWMPQFIELVGRAEAQDLEELAS